MTIDLRIDNDALSVMGPGSIVSGSKNYYSFNAVFTSDWNDLDRYVVFPDFNCSISMNDDNTAVLPEALISEGGVLTFGLIGKDAEGNLRITTNFARIRIINGASEASAPPPSPDDSATWDGYLGEIAQEYIDKIDEALVIKVGTYTWYIDSDTVKDKSGSSYGTLADCMTDDFTGTWFYVRTTTSEAGSGAYPSKYDIDGANGYLSLRDYVIWTGSRLVHVSTYEAKASTVKNSDGKYSPQSGVDGLMSSTQAAYLTDLINEYWGKTKLPVYPDPDPASGWQTNWLFDDGWYLGGIKADCGGHPPVENDNYTSWAVLVLNGMNTGNGTSDSTVTPTHNHRVQIAFDLVNSRIYMRRGWISTNAWADEWSLVGDAPDGSITAAKTNFIDPTEISTNGLYLFTKAATVSYSNMGYSFTAINLSDEEVEFVYGEIDFNNQPLPARSVAKFQTGSGGMFMRTSVYSIDADSASSDELSARISALEASQGSITIEGTDGITYIGRLKTVNGKPVFEYEAVEGENQNE